MGELWYSEMVWTCLRMNEDESVKKVSEIKIKGNGISGQTTCKMNQESG